MAGAVSGCLLATGTGDKRKKMQKHAQVKSAMTEGAG